MKIERGKKNLEGYGAVSKLSNIVIRKSNSSAFDQELAHKRQADNQMRMQELLNQIDQFSAKLSKTFTIQDLFHYKKLVKQFLFEAINRAYVLQHERGRNRRGRIMLITINVIDKEVEKVIEDFAAQKKEPMDILGTLDKIRGMMIDLMV